VTPEEFAKSTGLTLEEATYILARRAEKAEPVNARVERARSILAATQKRVGVHPVVVADGEVVSVHDPDADNSHFYLHKESNLKKVKLPEPESMNGYSDQFPGSDYPYWDEFDQSGGDK
jgi:hypothetical protein